MISLKQRTPDEVADIYATGGVIACSVCHPILGDEYPLWGAHLQAAIALHAAHRVAEEMRSIPALTDEDRWFGRHLMIGPKP